MFYLDCKRFVVSQIGGPYLSYFVFAGKRYVTCDSRNFTFIPYFSKVYEELCQNV